MPHRASRLTRFASVAGCDGQHGCKVGPAIGRGFYPGPASLVAARDNEHSRPWSKPKLQAHDTRDGVEIVFPECPQKPLQAALARGGDLVRHGFPPFPTERHESLGRVETFDLTREWHHLDPVQHGVGGVVAQHHGRTGLLDLATDRGVEGDQPDLAAPG